jgi:hypothetical protein
MTTCSRQRGFSAFTLTATFPSGIPPGFPFSAQMWISDAGGPAGYASSNAVEATAQIEALEGRGRDLRSCASPSSDW